MDGNNYDYGFRIYNPQIGRFLSLDPLQTKFPWYTPYQFSGNSPVANVDLDGREEEPYWKHLLKNWLGLRQQPTTAEDASNQATERSQVNEVIDKVDKQNQAINNVMGVVPGWSAMTEFGQGNTKTAAVYLIFDIAGEEVFRYAGKGIKGISHIPAVKMDKVKQVAAGLKNAEVFKPTEAAETAGRQLLKDYNGKTIPDEVVKTTQIYKENVGWINDVKKAGYSILDTGGGTTSTFYNMEKTTVYGKP